MLDIILKDLGFPIITMCIFLLYKLFKIYCNRGHRILSYEQFCEKQRDDINKTTYSDRLTKRSIKWFTISKCEYCGSSNDKYSDNCKHCGAPSNNQFI